MKISIYQDEIILAKKSHRDGKKKNQSTMLDTFQDEKYLYFPELHNFCKVWQGKKQSTLYKLSKNELMQLKEWKAEKNNMIALQDWITWETTKK